MSKSRVAWIICCLAIHASLASAQPSRAVPKPTPHAPVPATAAALDARVKARKDLAGRFGNVEATSASSDVLQAIGQVVVKKAVRAGWTELSSKLSSLAGCSEKTPPLPNTCQVLGKARIEDLLASPRTLLDAFTKDILAKLATQIDRVPDEIKDTLAGLVVVWAMVGHDAVAREIRPWLEKEMQREAGQLACPDKKAEAVAWVLAECYVGGTHVALANLNDCDLAAKLRACPFRDGTTDVQQVAELAVKTMTGFQDHPTADQANRDNTIQLFFEWGKLAAPARAKQLASLEDVFVGLSDQDWTRTVIGIGGVADSINTDDCNEEKHQCKIGMKLVRIVGSIGQFAQTYSSSNKSDPTAAREKVIEDLVTSLVDRSERDHGAVVSLGGALAVFAGGRFNDGGTQIAMPVKLTLGVGLQTYGDKDRGFHVSVDAFDLGQYVTYSQGSLDVGSPDLKSVVIAGVTFGYWFSNRDTPMFIGGHVSASPFVRSTDGKITYEAGLTLGVYVPLFDFN